MFCTYFTLFSVFLYTLYNTFSIGWPTFLWRFHFSFTVCFHCRGHTYIVCEMWNESSSGWPCVCTHTDSRAVAAADGLIILVVMAVLTRVKASFCSLGGRETLYFREPPVCESTEEVIIGSLEKELHWRSVDRLHHSIHTSERKMLMTNLVYEICGPNKAAPAHRLYVSQKRLMYKEV